MMWNGMMGGGMGIGMLLAMVFWLLLIVGAVLLVVWALQKFVIGGSGNVEESAQEWPQTASRMFSRMSMMSGMPMMRGTGMEAPSTAQQKEIVEYLSRNARK